MTKLKFYNSKIPKKKIQYKNIIFTPTILYLILTLCSLLPHHINSNPINNDSKIKCKYSYIGDLYGCTILKIFDPTKYISSVEGEHINNESDDTVNFINITNNDILELPAGIHSLFPNVEKLDLTTPNLNLLCHRHLNEFKKLQELYIRESKISALERELFHDLTNMNNIYIISPSLKYIEDGTFENFKETTIEINNRKIKVNKEVSAFKYFEKTYNDKSNVSETLCDNSNSSDEPEKHYDDDTTPTSPSNEQSNSIWWTSLGFAMVIIVVAVIVFIKFSPYIMNSLRGANAVPCEVKNNDLND